MARLCIPGVPSQKGSLLDALWLKTQASLRPLARPCRSLLPTSIPLASARPFTESKQGFRLPIRSLRPTHRPSFRFTSLLEERRAARQARSRPWAVKPKAPMASRSNLSFTNLAQPSKPKIQAIYAKAPARVGKAQDKPETRVKAPSKDKPLKKYVHFGETTVVSNPRWIVRREHVFVGPPMAMGHLQDWSVTPLLEPDRDGEEEKYATHWGSDSYVMLTSNHAEGPCDRFGCAWNALAWYQTNNPTWNPGKIDATQVPLWHGGSITPVRKVVANRRSVGKPSSIGTHKTTDNRSTVMLNYMEGDEVGNVAHHKSCDMLASYRFTAGDLDQE
ncbi:hypothetical protein BJX64DRAFT_287606 [Aspergillus heterothallicus]